MRFHCPSQHTRFSILPLVAVAFVPAVLVLALACMSLNRAEEMSRLPVAVAQVPAGHDSPIVSVRLARGGELTIAGQPVDAAALAAAWQRERAALDVLGYAPSHATVVMRAEADTPMSQVERLIGEAQAAGFSTVRLR